MQSRTYHQRGLVCTDHLVEVPLDHADPEGEQIEVFARELCDPARIDRDLPRLLFFQGGPGGKGPRPLAPSGFVGRALQDYRVVLMDQRGTGRSTPANRQTLARRGGPEQQAGYLTRFRADAIVRDAEVLRHQINRGEPWSTLGQSYGGFITLTYLSLAPQGVREAFVTGGLPPLGGGPDVVYDRTYERVLEKNEAFFDRYPGDQELCQRIVRHLDEHEVRLPTGERLGPRRFQGAGIGLGQRSGFDALHFLLEEAFVEGARGPELSDTFLTGVNAVVSAAPRPLYAVLQELIYCQGEKSAWSAERIHQDRPEFAVDPERPFRFTGEMFYPFCFDEDPALAPLREVADLLAHKDDWPALYDADQLARNDVPVTAAIYYDDMYVAREHSLATAAAVRRLRPWITNEFEHDGLREGQDVLDHLFRMSRGEL